MGRTNFSDTPNYKLANLLKKYSQAIAINHQAQQPVNMKSAAKKNVKKVREVTYATFCSFKSFNYTCAKILKLPLQYTKWCERDNLTFSSLSSEHCWKFCSTVSHKSNATKKKIIITTIITIFQSTSIYPTLFELRQPTYKDR